MGLGTKERDWPLKIGGYSQDILYERQINKTVKETAISNTKLKAIYVQRRPGAGLCRSCDCCFSCKDRAQLL